MSLPSSVIALLAQGGGTTFIEGPGPQTLALSADEFCARYAEVFAGLAGGEAVLAFDVEGKAFWVRTLDGLCASRADFGPAGIRWMLHLKAEAWRVFTYSTAFGPVCNLSAERTAA